MKHSKRAKKESSYKTSRQPQAPGKHSKLKSNAYRPADKEKRDAEGQFYPDNASAEDPFEDNIEAFEDTAYENYSDEDDDDY